MTDDIKSDIIRILLSLTSYVFNIYLNQHVIGSDSISV